MDEELQNIVQGNLQGGQVLPKCSTQEFISHIQRFVGFSEPPTHSRNGTGLSGLASAPLLQNPAYAPVFNINALSTVEMNSEFSL